MRSCVFTVALACAGLCATAADAQLGKPGNGRPVTANDLTGKKICWNDGGTGIFGAHGQYTRRGKHFEWFVTEPGIVKIGNSYHQYEILPDGTFYSHMFNGRIGSITGHYEYYGHVCD